MNNMPLEADTRILIDTNLKNLGWSFIGTNRNVFVEQAKTQAENKKLCGKKPDYVLYSKDSDIPLIVIEAKKPGKRIDAALEQGIYYAKKLEAPLVFATDGVFCKSFHTIGNTTPQLNGEDIDEFIREVLALKFLTKWDVNTVSPKVQYDRKELIKIFDEANNMLRGDGLRAGIERFGEFANILFLKLISESEQIKRESDIKTDFDIACSWDSIKNIPASTRIDYINKTVYEKLNSLYKTEIFTSLTIRDNSILKDIMDKLDPLTLTDVDSDVKGDAFEYFLKASTSSKNDLGEYFTPRHIVKTMVRLVNPQIGEKIYDPFCGTGGFLIESFRHIYNNMARTDTNLKMLKENTVFGNEITNTARITKMNMILAGDGHSNIHMLDSLTNPVDGTEIYKDEKGQTHHRGFDIVLANMPYSQKTKHGSLYDLPSTNGDSICVQHCMKAINSTSENGRMALVVPEGFLFRKDLAKVREYMLERCELRSIISLPQGVFLPYTGVKTNIIYATKVNRKTKTSEKRKDFWYFDVKSDGYTLDNHRRKLDKPSDLSKYEEYRKLDYEQADDMMKVGFEMIPLDKVRENDFILVGNRYRERIIEIKHKNIVKLKEVVLDIKDGGTPSRQGGKEKEYFGGNINWCVVKDIKPEIYKTQEMLTELGLNNCSAKVWEIDSIIISLGATIGNIGIAKVPTATKQGLSGIIVDKTKIMPKFLYYILHCKKQEIQDMATGATIKEVRPMRFIESLQIPLPSLDMQQQIVDELDGYQRIVDGARAVVDSYRPAVNYHSDWKTFKLKEVCKFTGGTQPPKSTFKYQYEDGYIRLLQIRDYKNDDYATYIPSTTKHKTCLEDDIMIGRYGPPVFQILRGKSGAYNVALIKCIPDESRITKDWLYYFLNSTPIQDYIVGISIRARQSGVSPADLGNLDIPLPSIEEQKQVVAQINTEQALIEPSKQLIEVFTKKIQHKINDI